jgi:hypothetical protein
MVGLPRASRSHGVEEHLRPGRAVPWKFYEARTDRLAKDLTPPGIDILRARLIPNFIYDLLYSPMPDPAEFLLTDRIPYLLHRIHRRKPLATDLANIMRRHQFLIDRDEEIVLLHRFETTMSSASAGEIERISLPILAGLSSEIRWDGEIVDFRRALRRG